MNLPNALTTIRLLLVPIFIYFLTTYSESVLYQWLAAGFYFAAAMTDVLDGYLARRNNQITNWGKIADPIADKALTSAGFIGLSILGIIPWWITLVILIRELTVTALRFYVIKHEVIAASRGGKAKTLSQSIAIVTFLIPLPSTLEFFPLIVLYFSLALTLITGFDYFAKALKLRKG